MFSGNRLLRKRRRKRPATRFTKVAVGMESSDDEFGVLSDERCVDEGVFRSRYLLHELVFACSDILPRPCVSFNLLKQSERCALRTVARCELAFLPVVGAMERVCVLSGTCPCIVSGNPLCAPVGSKAVFRSDTSSCKWQVCLIRTRKHSFSMLSPPYPAHMTVITTSQARLADRIVASRRPNCRVAGWAVCVKTGRNNGPVQCSGLAPCEAGVLSLFVVLRKTRYDKNINHFCGGDVGML